jgi:uncharacterized LabA/DUF88 family protein
MNGYKEKFKSVVKGRVGIFIDAANLESSVRGMWVNPKDVPDSLKHLTTERLGWSVDYRRLKEFFLGLGSPIWDARFYAPSFGTPSHQKFLYFMDKGAKFTLITKPLKEYIDHSPEHPHRKANFDVELSIDAIEHIDNYDTFILFSGDCDFEYLLKKLRGNGKLTIVLSRAGHVAKELPPACHHYFDIVDFRDEFMKVFKRKELDAEAPSPAVHVI